MRLNYLFVLFFFSIPSFAQFRLYEEGIKKYNEKDYYAAIELFSDFLTKPLHDKKFDADTYYWRGLAAFRLNDFVTASEDFKLSLSLNHPNSGNIHWFNAKCLHQLHHYDASAVEYSNAIRILESDKAKKAQLLAERAQVYLKLDKAGAALQDLQIASSIDPKNETIKSQLGELSDNGQSRKALVASNNQQPGENKKDPTVQKETPPVTQKEVVKTSPPVVQKQEEKILPKEDLAEGKKEDSKLTQPVAQKQEDLPAGQAGKKVPVVEQKEEKKQETVAKNESKTNPQTQSVVIPPPVVAVPVQTAPAEPTLADLYKDEKRFALVIGNSAYPKEIGVLKNPANDATDFAAAIKSMGFEVTLITDASYGKIRAEMMKFRDKLNLGERDKTVGLFYYAGHGLQHDSENYIVPVDAELQYEDDISRFCFPIQKMVLTQMENTNSRMNIVILDACRNNPFPALHRGVGDAQGLGEVKKARGAFIAYATSPGSVASDGNGRNGLYTQELIKAMNKPNRTIEQVFKDVRGSVLRQSGDKQNPWENSNITGDFYFKFDQ
jgi:tetratricopeptide (TPR) repeat protein